MTDMTEVIVHNRNFSKIDTPDKNYVATGIILDRNYFIASIVSWKYFCCMMYAFCIENTDDYKKC